MLIVALVLAVIGLAALVTAVVTSNELIAWVCIGASIIGVLLLVVDAVRERSSSRGSDEPGDDEDASVHSAGAEDHPEQSERPSEEQPISDDDPVASQGDPSDDGGAGKPGTTETAKPE